MELQPESWGLTLAPSVQQLKRDIVAVGANKIRKSEWFIEESNKRLGPALELHISTRRKTSFVQQAEALARLAVTATTAGFEFAGHIAINGTAQVNGVAKDELWGLDSQRKPVVLFRNVGSWLKTNPQQSPYTPLYSLKETRERLLQIAAVDLTDPLIEGALPPLFKTSTR